MNFDANGDNIRGLLTSTRTYIVPRFQRDFSWDENNYKELLNDLLSQINYIHEKDEFEPSQYYLGNMIFLGTKDKSSVEIIDGQQRLTTGTILLASIRDALRGASKKDDDTAYSYAETTQTEYLVKKIDGKPQRKLKTTTSYPYFTQTIQGDSGDKDFMNPSNEEEEALKKSFEFFNRQLKQNKLLKTISQKCNLTIPHDSEEKEKLFIEALKALRDQFLSSEIVEIFVGDSNQAHRIFENINSKGKPLSQVDLIKNDIFSKISINSSGVDLPSIQWKKINSTLSDLDTNFNEFFLHFWKSKYPFDSANGSNVYKKYIAKFKDDNENIHLKKFIKDLEDSSLTYASIIKPSKDEFKKQENRVIYQSLFAINKFRGVQSRVAILSLFNNGIKIKQKDKNSFLLFLANFHFAAFGTDIKLRSNLTTNNYKIFCQSINNAKSSEDIINAMKVLEKELLKLIGKESFIKAFSKLDFKKDVARNGNGSFSSSYAIKIISDRLENRKYNDDDYSIEHIIDESGQSSKLSNIGNLTVLERKYNDELNNLKNEKKYKSITYKKNIYLKSNYKMPRCINVESFDISKIDDRANKLANYFWDNCLSINQ